MINNTKEKIKPIRFEFAMINNIIDKLDCYLNIITF